MLRSPLAQAYITFAPMSPQDPIFVAPPPTEIPDYVWDRRYDRPCFLPGRPVQKPKEEGRRIPHPDAESALQAAKRSCRGCSGRWFGRSSAGTGPPAFLVYEGGKVIERHVAGK